jgi:hypothetical protein
MLVGVEAHEVSSFLGNLNFPLPAYHCGMLRGEASIIIKAVERTAHSVGFLSCSRRFSVGRRSPRALGGMSESEGVQWPKRNRPLLNLERSRAEHARHRSVTVSGDG